MISHLVLFAPKPTLNEDQKLSFALAIRAAGSSIPGISRASVGRSVHIDAGYQRELGIETYPFVAVLEFASRDALVGYLTHPLHEELGRLFWLYCERSIVTEVETRDIRADDLVSFLTSER